MARELLLSGFRLTREDWDTLDDSERQLFTEMLAEEGRRPQFGDAPTGPGGAGRRSRAGTAPL